MSEDKKNLAVAFDLGSTTVVGALLDVRTGEVLATAFRANPQVDYGADVLSRVKAVVDDPTLLATLQASVVKAINEILFELGDGVAPQVSLIVAAGNSIMEHILLGVSPKSFATVPYRPVFKEARYSEASTLGIDALPGVNLYTFPIIGGFVGGDTVAAILKLALQSAKETSLMIDIGTNSEIVLSHNGTVYAASAAAGSAFEGGEIGSGMSAQKGAIESVRVDNGELKLEVIGDVAPRGICGSGLLDAVAALVKAGVIESTGRIKDPEEVETGLSSKVRASEGDVSEGNRVILNAGPSGEIALSQADIRSLQTAKGAIRAGVGVLLKKASIGPEEVDRVYLAGAFGSNLKKEGLETTGLLDVCWHDRLEVVGDAALGGRGHGGVKRRG